jgi:ketosteroid isomerase-like protein
MQTHLFAVLEKFYAHFTKGDASGALEACAEGFSFQIAGQSPLAGKYGRNTLASLVTKTRELSGGTYSFTVHDILTSDLHGTVLGSHKLMRGGKTTELRSVNVWRFENGRLLAGYDYPRDLYAFDAAWN